MDVLEANVIEMFRAAWLLRGCVSMGEHFVNISILLVVPYLFDMHTGALDKLGQSI